MVHIPIFPPIPSLPVTINNPTHPPNTTKNTHTQTYPSLGSHLPAQQLLALGLRQHAIFEQHCTAHLCGRKMYRSGTAQGAGEMALVKDRLPHLPECINAHLPVGGTHGI
jgi:hypothetical protein